VTISGITTKILGSGDGSVLERVAADVFDHPVNRKWTDEFLNDEKSILAVACSGDTVVGMATGFVYLHPDKPLQLFINEIGVSPNYQRKGIGKRLLQLLLDRSWELGCHEAWVATEVDNDPARGLYRESNGREDSDLAVVYTYSRPENENRQS